MGLGEPKKRPESDTTEQVSPCAACAVRDMAFCGALNDREMPHLLAILQTATVEPHGSIIDEGEAADYLFNVTQGAVKLYKLLPDGRRQITGFLFEGDFLGIAMNERYAYSAEAVGQISLCRFSRRKLERLLDEFPKLEKRLLGMASNELVQAQDQILLLGRKTAQEKIVSFLLNLSDRQVKRGAPASPILLPMGRADIADYLGLTTETVSRTITNLKRKGYIKLLQGGMVELPDSEALQELAEGS
ncbi:MAG: helix-turn-helix domain-containing protein [Alphaproteobacteria bacterium]|jgi:CRP/FNR family transcriptional regulator|nr:helix-turn-helix domain-containing protein [Alphaproteobacteria bacterium]